MNHVLHLRRLAVSLALIGATGLALAQSGAPATPGASPTVTGTVKPGSGDQVAPGPATTKSTSSPTTTGTVKPGSGDQPGMSSGMAPAVGASPTATQTVKPSSRSARAREQLRLARMKAAKSEQNGSGSAGNVAGRVEGSTSSNSAGKPSKAP